ncbi:MAG: hypothetical protein Q9227_003472 [Pyrenula ochraceoflavens]
MVLPLSRSVQTSGYRPLRQDPPSQDPEDSEEESLSSTTTDLDAMLDAKRLGKLRAIFLVSLCCIGSFIFAYDTGIVGGVLTLKSFQNDFNYTKKQQTSINSNAVSVLQGGAFFGCFFVWPITSYLGRKYTLMIAAFIFIIGSIVQVCKTHHIGAFYAGRVVAGLGVGAATVLVPMFSAEMAPKEMRGALGSCFQLFFATGVMLSYWVDYGAKTNFSNTDSKQWQIPIGLQLVPSGMLALGMLLVPDSARWLAKKGRNEEALKSLVWVRGGVESPEVRAEFMEIQAGIEEELRVSEGFVWKELLLKPNLYRLVIAFTIQMCAQFTGNTSLAYYAPQIFATVGGGTSTNNLFVTGFFGVVKVVGVGSFVLFAVADRVGRRVPMMVGAFAMGTFMLIIAVVSATHPPKKSNGSNIASSGIASIIMVYLEAFSYNMSWGPLPWLYISEIFPSRIREIGIATGASSQWLWNFVFSQITPHAITNIGWRTFLMFAIFNWAIIGYTWFFVKETNRKSLEEMDVLFGQIDRLPVGKDAVEEGEAGTGMEGEGQAKSP